MVVILSVLAAFGLAIGAAWVLGSPKQQPDRAAEAAWSQLAETLDWTTTRVDSFVDRSSAEP